MFLKTLCATIIGSLTLECFGYAFYNLANSGRQINNENYARKTNFGKSLFSKDMSTFSTNKYESNTFFWEIHPKNDTTEVFRNDEMQNPNVTDTEIDEESIELLENKKSFTTEAFQIDKMQDINVSDIEIEEESAEFLKDTEIKLQNITLAEEITTLSDADSYENENYEILTTDMTLQESYETIFLARNHCNLEIFINNFDVVKIHFQFESLKNYSAGSCCIMLHGNQNTKLAVIITDIFLVKETSNENEAETLKVISKNSGIDFVLKKYEQNEINQSVLLSESSKVFVLLQYNVTTVASKNLNSRFNIEVFNYEKNANSWNNSYFH